MRTTTAEPKMAKARNEEKLSPKRSFFGLLTVRNKDGSLYLQRLRLLRTPWFGVYFHRLHSIDSDRALHDHPWSFISFVLRGFYNEEVPGDLHVEGTRFRKTRVIRWFNRHRAEDLHRISYISRSPVWTLVLVGPRRREWGFQVGDAWIPFDSYQD